MKCIRNTFLILVGVITIAFDEVCNAIEEAANSIDAKQKNKKKPFIESPK